MNRMQANAAPPPDRGFFTVNRAVIPTIGVLAAVLLWIWAGPAIGGLLHPPRTDPFLVHDGTMQFYSGVCAHRPKTSVPACLTGRGDAFRHGSRINFLAHLHYSLLEPGYNVRLDVVRSGPHGNSIVFRQSLNRRFVWAEATPVPGTWGSIAPTFAGFLDTRGLAPGRYTVTIWETPPVPCRGASCAKVGLVLGAQGTFDVT
jgi:hypothetical protein